MKIHNTAIIEGEVEFLGDAEVGPYSIIRGRVKIGDGTKIGSHVVIEGNVEIGTGNKIFPFVYIGGPPQDLSYDGEESFIKIGNYNVIREYVTVHLATGKGNTTEIANNNYIMAYAHIAHNVKVGSNCIIVNAAQLAGYVEVGDHAFVSGLVGVHQFTRIGGYSIIGGGVKITQDVLPFMRVAGEPPKVYGINIVGLRRKGFSSERIKIIKSAYDIICRSGLSIPSAVEKIKEELPFNDDIAYLINFISSTKRGILRRPPDGVEED